MIRAFTLSLAQLRDPRILKVLAKSLLLTLGLFALGSALVAWLLTGANPCGWGPLGGDCTLRAGGGAAVAVAVAVVGLWFLFPAVAIGVMGLFSDEVVDAVEARHYPDAAASARRPGFGAGLRLGLRSAGRVLLWNLVATPLYVILLVTGIGPFLLFAAVNAVALGRDLGEMIEVRRYQGEALARRLAATRVQRAALGLVVTFLFMIPFANLLAPAIGAAMATHLFRGGPK